MLLFLTLERSGTRLRLTIYRKLVEIFKNNSNTIEAPNCHEQKAVGTPVSCSFHSETSLNETIQMPSCPHGQEKWLMKNFFYVCVDFGPKMFGNDIMRQFKATNFKL